MKTKLIAFILIVPILFLGYKLVDGIKSKIDLAKEIKASEATVVSKLKQIREIQKAYFSTNGEYCGNWDSLVVFVKAGKIYTTEKREIIKPREKSDPLFYTNTDSIRIEIDTLATEDVMTKLFPKSKFPDFDPERIPFIPGQQDKKFEIFAGKTEKGGVTVDVVEVVDKYPMDKSRNDKNASRARWFLRFGSRSDVTITGNWE